MRDFIQLFVNGNSVRVTGEFALWTLSDYLRLELGLVGTKIVCNEGDCGACSVLIGHRNAGELQYRSCDSCILFLYQLDQTHIVTIEGLGSPEHLSAVQRAMVDCHGSQCGYCTPGFVVALHGLFEEQSLVDAEDREQRLSDGRLRVGLSGNLCRCTGYLQIIDAARSIPPSAVPALNQLYPPEPILDVFDALGDEPIEVQSQTRRVFVPRTVEQALEFKADQSDARLVSGATDIGVQHNHGRISLDATMCLTQLEEWTEVVSEPDALIIGSCATWTQILPYASEWFPEFADILLRFGSPQIRNFGTIGGNLANASPIADSIPFLYVIGASLKLRSASGTRQVPINEFYRGYKQFDLRDDELIESIRCPRLEPDQQLKLYKVSKRRDMDISTFTAAFLLQQQQDKITQARVALGGVGPTVLRTPNAESVMVGHRLCLDTMRRAGSIARSEISPISDVRGTDAYRYELAEKIFVKCYHDVVGSDRERQEEATP